jgi:hypothetical protein
MDSFAVSGNGVVVFMNSLAVFGNGVVVFMNSLVVSRNEKKSPVLCSISSLISPRLIHTVGYRLWSSG